MLVHRLRLALGGAGPSPILSDHGWIALNPAYDWELDLDRLEESLRDADGDIDVLEQAAALYRGEPLVEDRYQDWATPVRDRAQHAWRDLSLRLASLHRSRGSFDAAGRWYERTLEADPLDEEAMRGLLALLSLAGRSADAVRRYQQFERRLAEEMDVPPSAETLDLIQGIRTQLNEPSPAMPREPEGPLPVGRFLGAIPEGPLVGREEELERIFFAVDAVESGLGRLVLLAGEAGLGKTRLAQEIMMRLLERGFVVVANSCYQQHRAVPFYPLLDLLAHVYAAAPPSIRRQAPQRWPQLRELLPNEMGSATQPESDEEDQQYLLFRAVTGFLMAVAGTRPLALLLDDLQWADEGSLDLLLHLARQAHGSRLLVLGTYRDSDISNEHPLGRAVRTLSREGLLERLPVRHLTPEKTGALVTALLGEMAGAREFADFVYRRTKGSPFFIHKLAYTLGGRYRLVRQIGMGGMGRVFEALDVQTGERVAAKIMFSRTEADSKALLRFQQEAAVLAALEHPNIVKIHTTLVEEYASCIIMQLLEGRSLGHLMRDPKGHPAGARRLSLSSVRELMQQVAGALAAAHERGIVHRDVKPDNIIVGPDGHVTITDFGIARLVRPRGETSTLTSTGMTMGTPLYMAPEQIEGKRVDGRADIYALGAVMYQLVAGRPPFEGHDPLSIAFKHVHQPPDPPSWLDATVPEDWEALILKALAKDPADRFQSAVALERSIAALSAVEPRGEQVQQEPSARTPPPASSLEEIRRRRTRDGRPAIIRRAVLGALATLAAAAVAAFFIIQQMAGPSGVMIGQGPHGTGPGQFDGPTGIAVDARGHLFAVDQGNDRIQEFSASGVPLGQWGRPGRGKLEFDAPSDLALGPDGTIYLVDHGNGRILLIRSGRQVDEIDREVSGLAIGPRGTVFAPDNYHHRLNRFTADGAPLSSFPTPEIEGGRFPFPAGLAVGSDGVIYVADRLHDRIEVLSPDGRPLRSIGGPGKAPGQFSEPTDVALDAAGDIYVADARNGRVQKLSPVGTPLAAWARFEPFFFPVSIALDARGDVYVSDYANDRIRKLSSSGKPLWATNGESAIRF